MKYRCLVVDHDDTVVNSTATVHFPSFLAYLAIHRPGASYTLEEYIRKNFDPGVVSLFRDELGMSDEEMRGEQQFWYEWVQRHTPRAYEGIREILCAQKEAGGIVCVVSHSFTENILRDYRENGLPLPDLVFGWDDPPALRKPNEYPLRTIMEHYALSPSELLMLDDLKPGYDMAKRCGVPFAAAGWSNDIPQIERFMRQNCDLYFKTVAELAAYLQTP
jgi:phosphoglycolate phosphatase/pyrophosphatase PpaX